MKGSEYRQMLAEKTARDAAAARLKDRAAAQQKAQADAYKAKHRAGGKS